MLGVKGIRYNIEMAPTPEQQAELKRKLGERLKAAGGTPGNIFGWTQKIATIDEALAIFEMLKAVEDSE
jgi:hypothetical protein